MQKQQNSSSTFDEKVINTSNSDTIAIAKKTTPKITGANKNKISLIDFGGEIANSDFMLDDKFGTKKQDFSLITKAYANKLSMSNCALDRYHKDSGVKKLSNQKELPKTTEYKKALNGGTWNVVLNNNMIGLAPVSVIKKKENQMQSLRSSSKKITLQVTQKN